MTWHKQRDRGMSFGSYHHGMPHGAGGIGAHFQRPINWSALGKFDTITPPVQKHLQKVYATLSGGLLAAGLGAVIDSKHHVAGMGTQLGLFGAIIGLMFIHGKSPARATLHARPLLGWGVGAAIQCCLW